MQTFAGIAYQFGQTFFDIQMHIFQIQQPGELTVADFVKNLRHSALDICMILCCDDALRAQHFCMG